jgi:hypothetical protein
MTMSAIVEMELKYGRGCDLGKIINVLNDMEEEYVIDGETGQTLTPFDEKYWEGVTA